MGARDLSNSQVPAAFVNAIERAQLKFQRGTGLADMAEFQTKEAAHEHPSRRSVDTLELLPCPNWIDLGRERLVTYLVETKRADQSAAVMVLLRPDKLVRAVLRNTAHRLGVHTVLNRVLARGQSGGARWSEASVADAVAHVVQILGLTRPHLGDLTGKVGIEIGPGDNLGVSFALLALGCRRMHAIERLDSVKLDARQQELLREVERRVGGSGARADEVLRDGALETARLNYLGGEMFELAQIPEPVDFIFSNDVMEHVDDPSLVFRAAHRLLKPGGVFVSNIDLAGHNAFSNPRRPLDFLTCPDWLWMLMHSHIATTNRVRRSEFVAAAKGAGLRIRENKVLLEANRDYLCEVRAHLLPRYGQLPADDLGVVQCVLATERPALAFSRMI